MLPPAERFFKRHGGKAVFFARFFGGVRVTGAWMAGHHADDWWRFLVWNAAGGIVWAVGVGLLAYYAGKAAADALARYGVYAAIAVGVADRRSRSRSCTSWRRRGAERDVRRADAAAAHLRCSPARPGGSRHAAHPGVRATSSSIVFENKEVGKVLRQP